MNKKILLNLKNLYNGDKHEKFLYTLYNFFITILDLSFLFLFKGSEL